VQYRDLWVLGSLAVVLWAAACKDATAPKSLQHSPASPSYSSIADLDPDAPPLGIGGSVTISASGSFLPDVPLQASGLTLPPGIPVKVNVTGHVTRTQTDGLKFFCSFFVDLCAEFEFYLGEDPVPPSGVPVIDAAVAFASWDGGEGQRAPESGAVLTGPSGSELWVGRSQFFCEFSWDFGSGPCFTFGGSYTYTVHADSGDESAHLVLNVTAQSLGAGGGTVDLEVETSDGSRAEDVRWYFVPDVSGVIDGGEPPITTTARDADVPAGEPRLTIVGGNGAPSTGPPAGALGIAAAPAWTPLSSCDGNLTCHATIDVSAGTFVATALVHDTPRAAERRVSEGSSGGGPTLEVECTPNPVVRRQEVTCTGTVVPATAYILAEKRAEAEGHELVEASEEQHAAGDPVIWRGPAIVETRVTMKVRVPGPTGEQELTGTASFTVTPAAWPRLSMPGRPAPQVGSDKDLTYPPAFEEAGQDVVPDGTLGMHVVDYNTPRVNVSEGPNRNWFYVRNPVSILNVAIYTSRALEKGDPFYEEQRGIPPGQVIGTRYCSRADMDALKRQVVRHENAHYDAYVEYFAATDVQAQFERARMYVAVETIGQPGGLSFEALKQLWDERLDQEVFNASDAYQVQTVHSRDRVVIRCKFRYPGGRGP
jgi:hypothetical protein